MLKGLVLGIFLVKGVHQYYRFPGEILADCGAWGYIQREEPPFHSSETFEFYFKAGFDYGTSIDHLIVPQVYRDDPKAKDRRFNLVLENAHEMFEIWNSKDEYLKAIRIIGVAQGWDAPSYRRAVCELLKIGYDYIGIGGLARRPSRIIEEILPAIAYEIKKHEKETKKRVDIHIFGVARPNLIPIFSKQGVTSFDSATFLRWAWVGAKNNYLTLSGIGYTAIRVRPLLKDNPNKLLEQNVFRALKLYDNNEIDVHEVLMLLERFEKAIGGKIPIQIYQKTLEDKPWKQCNCPICSRIGVDVIVFRGNNRNRRRGFHNTHIFYKRFRALMPRTLVFTTCTAEKDRNPRDLPAYQRYMSSPVFKVFWNNVLDLPVELSILSAKFGLIDWSSRIPYYDYKMQVTDIPRFVEELKGKLNHYDKIFFIGLGLYRDAIQKVKDETDYNMEIFPKKDLTEREKLDIIEYTKQMKLFREAIINAIPEKCRPSEKQFSIA